MMNSFFIDVIKKVYAAMQKHTIAMKLSLDGSNPLCLREIVEKIISTEGTFDLLTYASESL